MFPVEIINFSEELSQNFADLNFAWVKKYFVVEPMDEKMLLNPKEYIIDSGGHIYFARINEDIVGTFALIKIDDDTYELSKMAVDEAFRGNNVGNEMMQFCINVAERLQIKKLILYSNRKLKPAIHLYLKYGFVEVPLDSTEYSRADIKMEKIINPLS